MLNGHLSDQVAAGYCTGQPEVALTDGGDGFEAQIRSNDVPGVVGHIRQDRKMWFTSEPADGNDGGASSAKGSGPNQGQGQGQGRRRLLRRD